MKYVPPRWSEAEALAFFERRRFSNLWGLLQPRRTGKLPYVERLWLPYYLIPFQVTSGKGPGIITVSVEGHSGSFALFEMHGSLAQGELAGETPPPKLTIDEATATGRSELLRTIMRRRGQFGKPIIEEDLGVDLFYYPYWIYYFERRRGLLDILICDAVTGDKGRARTKTGILSALVGDDVKAREALDKRSG